MSTSATDVEDSLPGWYGKLPGMGDFAHRRLPDEFRHAWDRWLQAGLAQLRARHENWTERYLQAPLWCFLLGDDVIGDSAWIGVIMPSVDSVGRYFPFTVAVPLDWAPTEIHGQVLARAQLWLRQAAQAAIDGLEQDLDAVRFDALLFKAFGQPSPEPQASLGEEDGPPDPSETAMLALPEMGFSLWFTDPEAEGGQGMVAHGLPQDEQFDALFGFWAGATSSEELP
ncbi:type VI secretion system-associated protein TagF [Variovorax sp. OV329]|uniref:type VI secretion system-associated protein TagF n=1 Tax=Variovorax sp. OV329 TaxID=1882825 RepID=UPI0008E6F0D5|nr:type VI secretion system-associated protein TagF [Variovorax sp. OV329]SFM81461.1 type VI secretion system protein ImpM [Variovorax sp. OV329]